MVIEATKVCAQGGECKAVEPGTGKLVFSEVITSDGSDLGRKIVIAESFRK